MTTPLSMAYSIISSSVPVAALLTGGVHTEWTIEPDLPRGILSWSSVGDAEPIKTGQLTVDIYADGNNVTFCEQVKEVISDAIEGQTFSGGRYGALRFFYGNDARVPEPDPNYIHWSVNFDARYCRIPGGIS